MVVAGRALIVSVLLALVAACGAAGEIDAASCAAPWLDDRPPSEDNGPAGATATVRPGETLTVYGHYYTTTCNDTGTNQPLQPMPPVRLTLTLPGGTEKDLGTFEPAGEDMGFAAPVRVPVGTPRGTAEVRDELGATFTFEVAPAQGVVGSGY